MPAHKIKHRSSQQGRLSSGHGVEAGCKTQGTDALLQYEVGPVMKAQLLYFSVACCANAASTTALKARSART
jgi:hypothetical protein